MKSRKKPWIEWLGHSNFSFLTGAAHPKEMVARALSMGYGGLAIADLDGLYGIARAYRGLKELNEDKEVKPNFKLFYGAEMHLEAEQKRPLLLRSTLAVYATDKPGYAKLCSLVSAAHKESKKQASMPLEALLAQDPSGLAVIQPMRGLIRKDGISDALLSQTGALVEHFGDRFHLGVSRHLHPAEDRWIELTYRLAARTQARLLFTQDPFFDVPEKKDLADLLAAIRLNQPLGKIPGQLFPNARRHLAPQADLSRIYGVLPHYEATLENSEELASRFYFDLDQLCYQYPREMIPEGFNAQSYLEYLARSEAEKRFSGNVPQRISLLIEKELSLIAQLGFADYFLTVWDIVAWARSQQILCQGRGSAANSAVCFVLGITAVDPDQFDLLFERFISVERGDPPDIDVDFENGRREEVIQYVYRRYGRERAAMLCNVVTFKTRGALRFSAKALGIPEVVITRAAKRTKTLEFRSQGTEEMLQGIRQETQAEGVTLENHLWTLWPLMAERLRGYPRHLSIHSGGFMLSDLPIDRLVPHEPASMEGRTVIQWCKEDVEGLGFFKIDLLALGMLTAMRRCFEMIKRHEGKEVSLASIPQNDQPTYEMIQRADTIGVFQIESAAQRASLPALRPANFYDLVVQVAIIRPGPILAGVKHPYLRRKAGIEPVSYPHPDLVPILKRTFGTIIFQEQLMRVAMAVGGFTPGEADQIRKNIGGFAAHGDLSRWISKLVQGMVEKGIAPQFIEEVILQIKGFSSYGFPESHAASFALLAYASCWLKRHHPAAFFASLLNSQPMGFYAPDSLIKAAKRDGVNMLPVSVNHSKWEADLEGGAIRLGFNQVLGLNEAVGKKIEASGPWARLEDFLKELNLPRHMVSALAAANAFSELGEGRRPALWRAEADLYSPGPETYLPHPTQSEQQSLFGPEGELESVELDYRATGTSLGRHPALILKEEAWPYPVEPSSLVTSSKLEQVPSGRFIAFFGMVLAKQSPGTAKGMLFVTLEDEEGSLQVVIDPPTYARFAKIVDRQSFLCLFGRLSFRDGAPALKATQVFDPDARSAKVLTLKKRRSLGQGNARPLRPIRSYM